MATARKAKPAKKPAVKPAAKQAAKKVEKAAAKPVAKPAAKPVVKPAAKPAVKPAAKPAAAVARPPVKPATVSASARATPEPKPVPLLKPEQCPCGSQKLFKECCGPIIAGTVVAKTAEQLMRARYVSYTKSAVPFIIESSHPTLRKTLDEKATETWSKGSQWHGLQIVATEKGGSEDTEGVVEFICAYSDKEQRRSLHERAKFVKEDGRWYYLDGEIVPAKPYIREEPKVGRNDPCPCGSGKKFKKCHGSRASQ